MGNRFAGGIAPGAMPPLHQYFGNPGLSWLGRLFFRAPVGDFYCGLRAFRRDALPKLALQSPGMELGVEMVAKAALYKLKVDEVPTTLSPDLRSRPPHLRTWRDGWRTLRFFLLYSPKWLFFYPGVFLMAIGVVLSLVVIPGAVDVFGSVGDAEELEELSDDEVWAVARPGPKEAAPTPTPARSDPATRAAATDLFMRANLTAIPGSQPGASA